MTQVTYTATAVTNCQTPWIRIDQEVSEPLEGNDAGVTTVNNVKRICDVTFDSRLGEYVVKMGHNVWDVDDISDVSYVLTHIAPLVTNMNRDDDNPIENATQYLNNNVLKFFHRERT